MTATPAVLIKPKLAETAETVQYTSDNCKTTIDKFTAVNTGGANATLTVHLVSSGGAAAGVVNAFVKTLAPGASWPFPDLIGHIMEPGDTISTLDPSGAVAIRASGRQFT
jgi:hypothetical protein